MSANLCWRSVSRSRNSLPDALKFILRDKYRLEGAQIWDIGNVSYLRGLADANVEGAQELIDAITKHNEVELWLEY